MTIKSKIIAMMLIKYKIYTYQLLFSTYSSQFRKIMEAGEPSRKKKTTRQITIEIFGTAIALTTLALPIFLITNFSIQNQNSSNSIPSDRILIFR
jgi:hypothetical protein